MPFKPGQLGASSFGSNDEFLALIRFAVDSEQAQQDLNKLGAVANEISVEQYREQIVQAGLLAERHKEVEKSTSQIQRNWWRTQRVLRASATIFRDLAVVGAAIWAPLIASAVKYNKDMEKLGVTVDEVHNAWMGQVSALQRAQNTLGRTTSQVLLPYLERAAKVANQVANFTARHPQAIEAALKIGAGIITLGTLGLLVTQGVKFVVDVKFVVASAQNLLASIQMKQAAETNLAAATAMISAAKTQIAAAGGELLAGAKGAGATLVGGTTARLAGLKGVTAAAGAGAAGAAGFYGVIAGFVALGTAAAYFVNQLTNHVSSVTGLGDKIAAAQQKAVESGRAYPGINRFAAAEEAVGENAKKGTAAVVDLSNSLERLEKEGEGARIILELQRDLLEKSKQYERDRANVLSESVSAVADAQKDYNDALDSARQRLGDTLRSLTTNFNKSEARAMEDYLHDRQMAVRNSNKQILEEEEKLQEKLRKLEADHNERVDDILARRDALALDRENQKYQREVDEATAAANKRIAKERQETAERLNEIDYRYQLERQRRYQDYIQRVQEAQAQYERDRKEAEQRRKEELELIAKQQAEKLAELKKAYNEEITEAINAAYEKIVLLRGAYDAELDLRNRYNQYILDSTGRFLEAMLKTFNIAADSLQTSGSIHGSSGVSGTRQTGGYVGAGLYRLHNGEYVMNRSITNAAERAIGGSLTNNRLMGLLAGGGGTTINIEFPGGLVTMKTFKQALAGQRASILTELAGVLPS